MIKEFDIMEFEVDDKLNLAKVWCSRADQRDKAKQQKLEDFLVNI